MQLARSLPIFCIFLLLNALPTPEVDPDSGCPVLPARFAMSAKRCGPFSINCPCATRNYWFGCSNRLSPDPCAKHLQDEAADEDSFNPTKFIIECVWDVLKLALPILVVRALLRKIRDYITKRKQKAMHRTNVAMFNNALAEMQVV